MGFLEIAKNALSWLTSLQADLFRNKGLIYLLVIAGLVTVVVGFILFMIDPNIRSLFDGIWYAWVTMTHVGYGDIVPASFVGRILAALLILFGLGLFALFTATFSAVLVGRGIGEVDREVTEVAKETRSIEQEESLILQELKRLHERLSRLEAKLEAEPKNEAR